MVDPGRVGEDKGLTEESLAEYKTLSIRPLQTLDVENDLEWISRSFSFLGVSSLD